MLAVRPPAYFPDFAFAALLATAKRAVLADTFAFSRQSAHHRTRIATSQGPMWLTVPCRHSAAPDLARVPLASGEPWARRHRRALHAAYASAPFYPYHADALDALLLGRSWTHLADLTCATTAWLCQALGVPAPTRASALPGAPATLGGIVAAAGAPAALLALPDAAPRDARALGTTRLSIRLGVLHAEEAPRRQVFPGFVPGTSALDLVMNYGPAAAERLRAAAVVTASAGAPSGAEADASERLASV
ncbi:MAG: WbqC family protein [Rubricoccaceae bacterium]